MLSSPYTRFSKKYRWAAREVAFSSVYSLKIQLQSQNKRFLADQFSIFIFSSFKLINFSDSVGYDWIDGLKQYYKDTGTTEEQFNMSMYKKYNFSMTTVKTGITITKITATVSCTVPLLFLLNLELS